jgi:hypothetical protein
VDIKRKDLQQSVRYDKGTDSALAAERRIRRRQAQVQIAEGKLYRVADGGARGVVFDTVALNLKTEFAGDGFAIFVWDHKKRLYSGQHIANSLHHSTPRGGKPVLCAGELRTNAEGKPIVLTSKTGHYTTTPTEFRTFLQFLAANNVLSNDTLCIPDTSNQQNGTWLIYAWAGGAMTLKTKADFLAAIPTIAAQLKSKNFLLKLAG